MHRHLEFSFPRTEAQRPLVLCPYGLLRLDPSVVAKPVVMGPRLSLDPRPDRKCRIDRHVYSLMGSSGATFQICPSTPTYHHALVAGLGHFN